jgi:outer membrane protein OmpA-like peptidoglycan-associated protein
MTGACASSKQEHWNGGSVTLGHLIALLACVLYTASLASAADVPGSKDPPGFKRYEGSDIIHYATRSYDRYFLARGEGNPDTGFDKPEEVDGSITRLVYRVPKGHTSFEVFRNYEQMLSDAGFTQTFELAKGSINYSGAFLEKFWGPNPNLIYDSENQYYATYKTTKNGQDISVAVLAVDSHGLPYGWREPGVDAPISVDPGQALVALDAVAAKAVEQKMVEVKAVDIADALATKGSIDLYGIYFDTDKADIKPESAKTLDEIANLLKIDRSLRLEISGHTDNTGTADHNMNLSQSRARSVVDALVKNYNIDAGRLDAKGYGDSKPVAPNDTEDGRAKNRRVELRKL